MKNWKLSLAVPAFILSVVAPISGQPMPVAFRVASGQTTGIQYATGGFGLEDRAEMQSAAGAFNVLLMFTQPGGEFLVADSVTVKKGNVDLLQVSKAGPLLYLNLPYGTYTVQADYKGVLRSKAVTVARRTPDVVITWPGGLD